jgi:hypothetical protein
MALLWRESPLVVQIGKFSKGKLSSSLLSLDDEKRRKSSKKVWKFIESTPSSHAAPFWRINWKGKKSESSNYLTMIKSDFPH